MMVIEPAALFRVPESMRMLFDEDDENIRRIRCNESVGGI